MLTGLADDATARLFVSLNVPLHTAFAAYYVVSLFLLLLVALKHSWAQSQSD